MPSFDLAESFLDHPLFIAVVFLTLFLVICGLFAAGDFIPMLRGMALTITSIFISPFRYLKKAIVELATYGNQGDRLLGSTDQYLINKILLILRALTIVASIGVLAASLVVGWYATLPPESLRLEISSTQSAIGKQREDLSASTTKLGQMETDWRTKRATFVDQKRAELTQKHEDSSKSIEQITQQIETEPQGEAILTNLRPLLQSNSYGSVQSQENAKVATQSEIARATNISDPLKTDLAKYVDAWYQEKDQQEELAALTEKSARAAVQPDWQETQNSADQLTQSVSATEQQLTALKGQAQYHPEELLVYAAFGLMEFLGLVWVWGVICEAIGLAVHMAGDVKRLRQAVEVQEMPSETLAPSRAVLVGD